jgi:hypothetical protein
MLFTVLVQGVPKDAGPFGASPPPQAAAASSITAANRAPWLTPSRCSTRIDITLGDRPAIAALSSFYDVGKADLLEGREAAQAFVPLGHEADPS